MIELILPLFMVVGVGFLAGKLGVIGDAGLKGLNAYVMWFAMPVMIVSAILSTPLQTFTNLSFFWGYLFAGLLIFAVVAIIQVIRKKPLSHIGVMGLAGNWANTGYMGLVMVPALMGAWAFAPVIFTLIVDMAVMTIISMVIVEVSRKNKTGKIKAGDIVLKTVIANPFLWSIAVGFLLAWLNIEMPALITQTLDFLGRAASPTALFAIGLTLACRKFEAGGGVDTGLIVLIKSFIHPVVVAVIFLWVFPQEPAWFAAGVILASLPVAGNVYLIASRYNVLTVAVALATLVTTVISAIMVVLLSYYLL